MNDLENSLLASIKAACADGPKQGTPASEFFLSAPILHAPDITDVNKNRNSAL